MVMQSSGLKFDISAGLGRCGIATKSSRLSKWIYDAQRPKSETEE